MQEFRISKGTRFMYVSGLGLVSLGLLGSLIFAFQHPHRHKADPLWLAVAVGYAAFTLMLFRGLKRARDILEVDDSAITRVSPDGSRFTLQWNEITAVRPREKLQRLDLYDCSAKPVMRIEYQIELFDVLRSLIYEKTRHLYESAANKGVFHKSTNFVISSFIFSAILLFAATMAWTKGSKPIGVLLVPLALYFPVVFLRATTRVTVRPTSLLLRSVLKSRELPYDQITNVTLDNKPAQRGDFVAVVRLELKDGTHIDLQHFHEGSLALFYAIERAWEGRSSHSP